MRTLFVVPQGTEWVECPVCGGMVELVEDGGELYVAGGCEHLSGCEVEQVGGKWEILVPIAEEGQCGSI